MQQDTRSGASGWKLRRTVDEAVFAGGAGAFEECHASTLVSLPGGNVLAAWFGGTEEGSKDVAIWAAIRSGGAWSKPVEVVRHAGIPTWNPVLFVPQPNELGPSGFPEVLMYYRVGGTIPRWRSNVMASTDGGQTWSEPKPLPDGILGPIKNKPIRLSDGAWLAGSSVETEEHEWFCVMERSDDRGRTWTASAKIALQAPHGVIQPTLWESEPGRVHALLRTKGPRRVARTDSEDGGRTWCEPYLIDLPHNNSGLDVAAVTSVGVAGEEAPSAPPLLALAYNPVETGRTPLVLALSADNGATWPEQLVLEDRPGEYSYPAVIPIPGGVAVVHTHNRIRIHYSEVRIER